MLRLGRSSNRCRPFLTSFALTVPLWCLLAVDAAGAAPLATSNDEDKFGLDDVCERVLGSPEIKGGSRKFLPGWGDDLKSGEEPGELLFKCAKGYPFFIGHIEEGEEVEETHLTDSKEFVVGAFEMVLWSP